MTGPAVEFLDPDGIDFVEHPAPVLTPGERTGVDRLWAETTARNPAAFDGQVVASLGVERHAAGPLVVRWAAVPYRMRGLRALRAAERVPGSLFVTVLLPCEGDGEEGGEVGLVVGRGSAATAAPGRWTLPGGAVEPPPAGQALDMTALRGHAARELVEETGVEVPGEKLEPWGLTRGRRFGSLGFHFLAPPLPKALVRSTHAALAHAPAPLSAPGGDAAAEPELDALAFVPSSAAAERLGPGADYLPQLLDRYFLMTGAPAARMPGPGRPGPELPGPGMPGQGMPGPGMPGPGKSGLSTNGG
ncbi:NUDIX hydrolase [Streptomyces sp. NPDC004327]|uniref:NUDIX hydrolase n=1 Tax=Streptomyces sp. NPDC004327 TaxID=3364699 RepID=UPI0036AA9E74